MNKQLLGEGHLIDWVLLVLSGQCLLKGT